MFESGNETFNQTDLPKTWRCPYQNIMKQSFVFSLLHLYFSQSHELSQFGSTFHVHFFFYVSSDGQIFYAANSNSL